MKPYLILDCYVDEPACLGVPPFVSPYPRYIYGALRDAGVPEENIEYLTIDRLRETEYIIENQYSQVFLIGGAVVPGRYLGAKIGTLSEIRKIISLNGHQRIAAGGMINRALGPESSGIDVIEKDIEKFAHTLASGNAEDRERTVEETARWSLLGTPVVKMHPWFPNVICEIETGRGCPRLHHCSFCSEGLFGRIEFREENQILSEIDSLTEQGVTRFRIGRQADIIQYQTPFDEFRGDFPRPNTDAVKSLFRELKDRRESGKIDVLNIDNGNPGSIVNWPNESAEILAAVAEAVTEGDTLPFGVESFDPAVVKANRLKVMPEEALFAVKLLNETGGWRRKGIPVLLPGINLIHGLKDENADTFRINFEYLSRMAEQGLLIKRINIRKLQPYPGTSLYNEKSKISGKIAKRFEYYRDRIRDEIDRPMLRKIYPAGTVLDDNLMLENRDGYSMGKRIGSYTITVKIPEVKQTGTFCSILITGQRERSLSGLALPFDINSAGQKAFESIPGIGKERASKIILARPFACPEDFTPWLEGVPEPVKKILLPNLKAGNQ